MCESRYFEDFEVGERFILPSRTMTDALFAAFQLASGDNHPVHYDVEYCRARGMPHMLAHGFQVLAQTCAGAGLFPHMVEDSLKGFIDQSSRFLAMVFVGDTLYSALEVAELAPNRTTGVLTLKSTVHNQRGVLVMDGVQRYLLAKRPAAGSRNKEERLMADPENLKIDRDESSAKGRYFVLLDGVEAEMTYSRAGENLIIIDHTDVPDALRGRSVGQALVRRAVEDARAEGRSILPLCPFAKAQIARHEEWQDVLKR